MQDWLRFTHPVSAIALMEDCGAVFQIANSTQIKKAQLHPARRSYCFTTRRNYVASPDALISETESTSSWPSDSIIGSRTGATALLNFSTTSSTPFLFSFPSVGSPSDSDFAALARFESAALC